MTERFYFASSDGRTELAAYRVNPVGKPCAMFQISHGMCQHFAYFEEFASYLAENGILVFGHDQLGHGYSVKKPDDLGFSVPGGGSEAVIEDVHKLSLKMKEAYPDLPLFLFGFSMGSFVIRAVLSRFGGDYAGGVICGTGGPEAPAKLGRAVSAFLMHFQGERHRSEFIKNVTFGRYNRHFGEAKDSTGWLTDDPASQEPLVNDERSRFTFTLRAYHDLFCFVAEVSDKRWAYKLPKNLPLLLISGEDDPVGHYGRGVKAVEKRLMRAGLTDLTTHLYPEKRHEILLSKGKEVVWEDILTWINQSLRSSS